MEAFVDNIWSSPSTLHFRVVVVTSAKHRVFKQECHIDIDSLSAVDIDHMRRVLEPGPFEGEEESQLTLWNVPGQGAQRVG